MTALPAMQIDEPVPFTMMTVDQIDEALRAHGFAIVALGARLIVGARPVPGHVDTTREIALYRIAGSCGWSGSVHLRAPRDQHAVPGLSQYQSRPLGLVNRWIRTLDELEAWIGGVSSVPVDAAETDAILRSA